MDSFKIERRNDLLAGYLGSVRGAARIVQLRYRVPLDYYDDLVSEGVLGLIESADRYDPKLQSDLWAFAQRHVYGRMTRLLCSRPLVHCRGRALFTETLRRTHAAHKNCRLEPVALDDAERREEYDLCAAACQSLTAHRDREVGLLMLSDLSLADISKALGISYPKVKRASHRVVSGVRKRLGTGLSMDVFPEERKT